MAKTKKSQKAPRSPFLNLPAEIRNIIYDLVLVKAKPISVTDSQSVHTPAGIKRGVKQPSLLRVCRAIRAETLSVFYSGNNFTIGLSDYYGMDWLQDMPRSNRALVKSVLIPVKVWQSAMQCAYENAGCIRRVVQRDEPANTETIDGKVYGVLPLSSIQFD